MNSGIKWEPVTTVGDQPAPRFGHTITPISRTKAILFGGGVGDAGKYVMSGDTYLLNVLKKEWTKLKGTLDSEPKGSSGAGPDSSCSSCGYRGG